jgi:uncharacterized protein (TIGR02246 family)
MDDALRGLGAEEAGVRALLAGLSEAWGRGDAAAYAALFDEDSDYVVFDGTRLRGRAENASFHRGVFGTVLAGTRLEGGVESVRLLTPEVALVHSSGGVMMPWQSRVSPGQRSRQTLVLVKRQGGWRIAAFQNTRLRPLPPLREGSLFLKLLRLWTRLRVALSRRPRPS